MAVYAAVAAVAADGTRPASAPALELRDADKSGGVEAFSVAVIELQGASADVEETDAGWSICLNVWEAATGVTGGARLDDSADYSAVLSDDCLDAFPPDTSRDKCGLPGDQGECREFLDTGIGTCTYTFLKRPDPDTVTRSDCVMPAVQQ